MINNLDKLNIDVKLSSRQLTIEDFNTISIAFLNICKDYQLSTTPLCINDKNIY